ncbi:ABC transporter substrate-binding protein [Aliikangiella sp. IMCC44359]|uniref:ABC transporter substrate-binding protein n=1 Tax=Aliikangiella sp. IMCC44359 TaxID=3459125 RepID=UPI00403ACBF1
MPTQIKRFGIITLIGLFTAVFLSGCNPNGAAAKRNLLVYCSEGSPETFNPQLSTSGTTFDASSRTLYNRLVEFKPGTTDIQPALATSWQISKDGLEYTFHLRKMVNFHTTKYFQPTRTFNADDVLFTFERQRNPIHPYHNISKLRFGYFQSMGLSQLIKSIDKLDQYTIKFSLNRAESPFLATMAMDFASIISAEYADELLKKNTPELLDTMPIGTGPFQLIRYQPDAFIRYRAHPHYWQGKQKLENLVFAITPNPSLRFARMVAGECDVMSNPLPIHIGVASQQPHMRVMSEPGLNIAYLALNTSKRPFDNVLVRRALNYAINKEAIIKAVYQQTATPAKTTIPPSMWAYDKTLSKQEYSLQKARNLLSQAGYANGFKMKIWTMSAQRAYNPNAKKMAELIQQDLKKIGITVEIVTYEYTTFLYKTRAGEHHAALMGWISDNGDPDNFFTPLLSCAGTQSGTNTSLWCDQNFNEIIQQARAISSTERRKRLYQKAQSIFVEASPWVPIAHATQHVIISPRVKNFKIIPAGGVYFNNVFLSKISSGE